jgi:hypothetical protein
MYWEEKSKQNIDEMVQEIKTRKVDVNSQQIHHKPTTRIYGIQ